MNNLTNRYNSELVENKSILYLSFTVGENKYAVPTENVLEIMKLPHLDYPQKLSNNVVGLLNYNNFTINVLDIRFYLDMKVTPYSVSNQLLIVKTDETFMGLIINRVDDIIPLDSSKVEHLTFSNEARLIDFLYRSENNSLAVLNLYALETLLKQGVQSADIDIPSLFPQDDESRYKFMQRNQELVEKTKLDLDKNLFTQDKFISFSLNGNFYCLNLNEVKEFLKNPVVTCVPGTPDYIGGIITLRGNFVTIIDLKNFLGLGDRGEGNLNAADKSRIILVESADFQVGFLVDEIFSIIDISEDSINQNANRHANKNILSEVVIDDKFYTILNVKNILSDERFFIEEN